MGKKVDSKQIVSVTIEPRNDGFVAFLSMTGFLSIGEDPEVLLRKVAKLYENAIGRMHSIILEMRSLRAHRKSIPARMMWKIGYTIFELRDNLAELSLQLDDIYRHLARDLGVKRKWLEKAIIFRRYLPKEEMIPESMRWGLCEHGTRRVAEKLRQDFPHE